MTLFAVKLDQRKWKENVDLPWNNLGEIVHSVYRRPDDELPDISPLCDYFRRQLLGIRHRQCQIEDVEARLVSDGLLEIDFLYDIFDDRDSEYRRRKMWVAI